MTLPERQQGLRSLAEDLDRYEGYRVEIIGGELVMSPSPRLSHARVWRMIHDQLQGVLPDGLVSGWGESVTSPAHGEDFVEPDLMVYLESCEQTEDWFASGEEVPLVVEVVSASNATRDTVDKPKWYAIAGVALFLLIDPRESAWRLYSEPGDGQYRVTRDGRFGDPIPVPAPIGIELNTDEFRQYQS